MIHSHTPKQENSKSALLQTKSALRIGEKDDRYEQEADRVADQVVSGKSQRCGWSLSKITIGAPLQREEQSKQKSEEEKYKEAAKKLGEAFLETGPGREIKEKAEKYGEAFISTLPGKIVAGSALTGAIAALAASNKELPVDIPEIPLDKLQPGLKVKITYEGPVNNPTKAMATFSIPLGKPEAGKKPALSKSQQFRAETTRMAMAQQQFREALKTPAQRAAEERMVYDWVVSRNLPGGTLSLGTAGSPLGSSLPAPLVPYAADFKVSGEQPKQEEPKKKKEETNLQRKAKGPANGSGAPAIVNEVLQSSGQPLEPATRSLMERRFGQDFSRVRIHTDQRAGQSANAINASAYTFGNDLVFANGQYSPRTQQGLHLLAHELTHVMQQNNLSPAGRGMPIIRRKEKASAKVNAPTQALKTALKGDDDSVRDLTKSTQWNSVTFTAEEAATLLVLLLDGATLDDDEIAGLAVLRKALKLGIFDGCLTRLGGKNRFRQLLDDYHGSEYRNLLDLLSKNISQLDVRALYLDAFIAMWWVREHEERAIVVLLERTAVNDLFKLLTGKNRQNELRDAIDAAALSIRYEKIAGKVNELRHADLAATLKNLFAVQGKGKQGKKLTADKLNQLLIAAGRDLAKELSDYRVQLNIALNVPKPDADTIAEINKDFEQRLGFLLQRKQEEFHIELKYGVQLNRLLNDARGRSWTLSDLKKIDKILAQIPTELLQANPKFKEFLRARHDPKLAGQATSKRVKLFGSLTLGTTAHELGHVISFDDGERLQNEFNKEFNWQILTVADFSKLIPNQKDRRKLLKRLDDDRKEEREGKGHRHAYGDYYYRYNRYSNKKSYLRHPKDACFITDYAATDRYDDFAEAFEVYFTDPEKLHKKCPKKYNFIRQKVMVGYLFGKQVDKVLSDFDQDVTAKLKVLTLPARFLAEFRNLHIKKLRAALKKKLEATGKSLEKDSLDDEVSKGMKRTPLSGKEARQAAKPYLSHLTKLLNLLALAWKQLQAFSTKVDQFKAGKPKKYQRAASSIGRQLSKDFYADILLLMKPYSASLTAGKKIPVNKWPQLEALDKKYQRALTVASSYLPIYKTLFEMETEIEFSVMNPFITQEKEEVGPTAWNILKRFPANSPERKMLKSYLLQRRHKLVAEIGQARKDIIELIKSGTPRKGSKVTTFSSLARTYRQDIRAFIKEKGLKIQRKANNSAYRRTGAAPLISQVLVSSGSPLPLGLRSSMESRFCYDFSRVRIHTDSDAAKAAQRVGASAFTSGQHIVFAEGRYLPMSFTGQRLLAHELTHVIQQTSSEPALQRMVSFKNTEHSPKLEQDIIDLPALSQGSGLEEPSFTGESSSGQEGAPASLPGEQVAEKAETAGAVREDHPSEREAERVASQVVSVAQAAGSPLIREQLTDNSGLSLDDDPQAKAAKRTDIAFIMGSDKRGSSNEFYKAASKYFKANLPGVQIVNDPKVRNLTAVFTYLQKHNQPIGTLYIISHAADDGTLSFPLQVGDKDRKVDYLELREALKKSPKKFKVPKGIIDQQTTIRIKGCRLGQSKRMLSTIGQAFGAGRVIAPKHRQHYGFNFTYKVTGRGRRRRRKIIDESSYQGFKTYFIARRGSLRLNRAKQIDAFSAKYSQLSRGDWEKLIARRGSKVIRKLDQRQPLSFSFTQPLNNQQALSIAKNDFRKTKFKPTKVARRKDKSEPFEFKTNDGRKLKFKGKTIEYTFQDKDGNEGALEFNVPIDEKEIIAAVKADESVPDAYDWQLRKSRKGSQVTYSIKGLRTVYSLNRFIVAKLGRESATKRLYVPPETSTEFFGKHTGKATKAKEK